MRLLFWNCDQRAGLTDRKKKKIDTLAPDVMVIAELRKTCLDKHGFTGSPFLSGHSDCPNKAGISIIAVNKEWRIESGLEEVSERCFLPGILTHGQKSIQIVGVWVKKETDYVSPTLRALNKLRSFILDAPTIVIGDFNQSPALSRTWSYRFAEFENALSSLGLRSAWHTFKKQPYGDEKSATLYWRMQRSQPRHIDYAFVPTGIAIRNVQLMDDFAELSDHVPLVLDLEV